MMSDDGKLLIRQLSDIISACLDYDAMHAEILTLLQSYTKVKGKVKGKIEGQESIQCDEENSLREICHPILLLLERLKKERELEAQQQQAQLVKAAINTLSYTELEVVVRIFEVLGGSEGILIAGKIADGMGITRSVVVSALRKLESARIVETRSLGVKGTHIKVLNPLWGQELRKLRV